MEGKLCFALYSQNASWYFNDCASKSTNFSSRTQYVFDCIVLSCFSFEMQLPSVLHEEVLQLFCSDQVKYHITLRQLFLSSVHRFKVSIILYKHQTVVSSGGRLFCISCVLWAHFLALIPQNAHDWWLWKVERKSNLQYLYPPPTHFRQLSLTLCLCVVSVFDSYLFLVFSGWTSGNDVYKMDQNTPND